MILKNIKGLFLRGSSGKSLQGVGDDISQEITITGSVRGSVFQVGKVVVSKQEAASPSILALRSHIDPMIGVPKDIGIKISTMENIFRMGGYKDALPPNPQVIDECLDELDLLCKKDGITLPGDWREEYWRNGLINAIQKSEKEMVLTFLSNADEDLIYWSTELIRRRSWVRWVFRTNFFLEDTSTIAYEMVLNQLEQAGLISQGVPPNNRQPSPARCYVHTTTELTFLIARLVQRFDIEPSPPSGSHYKF